MKIIKTNLYEKQKEKLIKKGSLSKEIIDKTEAIFLENPNDYRLRPHKIICKKDKRRRSISVLNTQYRILYTDNGDAAIFQQILNHKRYDRINKDC
ncbi:hypothetical protein [Nitratiruptor sp. SB155-2]|uniref:hypothetical protein n=1 Tax=Nitratiruptor sp. (strain SB155-2) TaxID=387092 RepID=UPI0002FABCC9|nr:hypothetical protein [Nitratiruptor sp. SB155-2]